MRSRRWRQALGPPLLVTVVAAGLIVPTIAASAGRKVPRDMAHPPVASMPNLPSCAPSGSPSPPPSGTWFRRDGVVDAGGQLTGYRLELGVAGSPTTLELVPRPGVVHLGPGRRQGARRQRRRTSIHRLDRRRRSVVCDRCLRWSHARPPSRPRSRRATRSPSSASTAGLVPISACGDDRSMAPRRAGSWIRCRPTIGSDASSRPS